MLASTRAAFRAINSDDVGPFLVRLRSLVFRCGAWSVVFIGRDDELDLDALAALAPAAVVVLVTANASTPNPALVPATTNNAKHRNEVRCRFSRGFCSVAIIVTIVEY